MIAGLLCALGTALCYGIGSVLQAQAAAAAEGAEHLDARLLVALARTWRYPVGLALDAVGFVLSLVALRSLPLYLVQAVVAGFLAVTALAGVALLGLRLRRGDLAALGAVVAGLVVVGLSAAPERADAVSDRVSWLLLAATAACVVGAVPAARATGRAGVWLLGAVAGLAFGIVAVAARALSATVVGGGIRHEVHVLVASPASYAILLATPLALVAYATALQRGSVVEATAPLVVGETLLPAVAGFVLLGDHTRPGWGVPAGVGFALALGGSLLLSRYGEVAPAPAVRPSEPAGR